MIPLNFKPPPIQSFIREMLFSSYEMNHYGYHKDQMRGPAQ